MFNQFFDHAVLNAQKETFAEAMHPHASPRSQ
jgi:hypothetical protein